MTRMQDKDDQQQGWLKDKLTRCRRWLYGHRTALILLPGPLIVVWILGTSNKYSIGAYIEHRARMQQVQQSYQYYQERYRSDSLRLNDVRTSVEHIEHIAREQYYMRTLGEENFLITPQAELADTTAH